MPGTRTVAVIDDDADVRTALCGLLGSAGYGSVAFPSAEAFLAQDAGAFACLVVDVRLPGMSGIELVRRLSSSGEPVTTILITGQDDDATRAFIKSTRFPCLRKPFVGDVLLATLERLGVG